MTFGTALAAPFPPTAVSWRAQNMKSDGTSALALAYIDARDVMDRLDAVCGPANWQDTYTETPKGRVLCTLSIRIDGEWISKTDGAGDTDVEGEKGAISDALKRAAVKWGIGRYLYDLGDTWAECEPMKDREGKLITNAKGKPQFRKWTENGKRQLAAALAKVAPPEPPIDDGQWAMLTELIGATSTNSVALCEHYKIPSLRQMTVAQFEDASARLRKRLPAPQAEQKEAA